MRIGIIGPTGPDTFADNITYTLLKMGVDAVGLGPATPEPRYRALRALTALAARQTAETESLFQRPLARRVEQSGCDTIISVQQSLMPNTVSRFKSAGMRVALWYPDSVSNISRSAMFASPYDVLFLKDLLLVHRLKRVYGLPAVYMPEACNPSWHRPIGDPGSDPYIVVVGNLYPTRARLLARLHAEGVALKLYGSDFPRWYHPGPLSSLSTGTYVTRDAKSRVFREARGVLNNLHPAEMNSVNARLFEAAGAGGAVLCEYRDVLPDLFALDQEVLAFSDFDSLLSHCQRLLSDRDLGESIGDAASARAHRDHTYVARLGSMLEHLAG